MEVYFGHIVSDFSLEMEIKESQAAEGSCEKKDADGPCNVQQGKKNEPSDADLDALIDAMGKMKKPDGTEEKSFEEALEVGFLLHSES